jgi:hypothetical protein
MNDYQRTAANLRARIAALRSRLSLGIESFEDTQAPRVQYSAKRPTQETRVESRVEPDWDAINRLKATNDAKEAKEAEMSAMKAKLRSNRS